MIKAVCLGGPNHGQIEENPSEEWALVWMTASGSMHDGPGAKEEETSTHAYRLLIIVTKEADYAVWKHHSMDSVRDSEVFGRAAEVLLNLTASERRSVVWPHEVTMGG